MKRLKLLLLLLTVSLSGFAQTQVTWDKIYPDNYQPSPFVQWADLIPEMKLPNGKIWVAEPGDWSVYKLYDKGVTHISKFAISKLPQNEIQALMRSGRTYDDVPITPVLLSLPDLGSGQWLTDKNGTQYNTRFFPKDIWPGGPADLDGEERGRMYNTGHALQIGETNEQDHWLSENAPVWRGYFKELARQKTEQFGSGNWYVAYNYGGGVFSQIRPGGNLEYTNLATSGIYLNGPDLVRDFPYRMIREGQQAHERGIKILSFAQSVHEYVPNNFHQIVLPEGKFYRQDKITPAPTDMMMITATAMIFQDGFAPFGFAGKKDKLRFVRKYNESARWFPNGATEPQSLDSFPYWVEESAGYYSGTEGVEDAHAFTVAAVNRTFYQVSGGAEKFLKFRLDGGPWVSDEIDLDSREKQKTPICFSCTRDGYMAVIYLNPYADNRKHKLEFVGTDGKTYWAYVSTNAPHLTLVKQ